MVRCRPCQSIKRLEIARNSYHRNKERLRGKRIARQRKEYRETWDSLSDRWVKRNIVKKTGLSSQSVTTEMIEINRNVMTAGRVLRKLWKEDKHGARFGINA